MPNTEIAEDTPAEQLVLMPGVAAPPAPAVAAPGATSAATSVDTLEIGGALSSAAPQAAPADAADWATVQAAAEGAIASLEFLQQPARETAVVNHERAHAPRAHDLTVPDLPAHALPAHELPGRDLNTHELLGHELPAHDLTAHDLTGRAISQRDLPKILELHLQWLVSGQAAGKQADLSGAQLQGANLTGADLRMAILRKTNLEGAELFMAQLQDANLADANLAKAALLGAQLHRADLQGANLDQSSGLEWNHLAGADLRGATLPSGLSEFTARERVSRLSRSAAAMLVAMLSCCGLFCARLFTATDAQMIKDSSALPLPHLGNILPMTAFLLVAPVLLLGICIALHLRLFRLWEAVESSPRVFPGGERLSQCGSWMVMALGFGQFAWLRGRRLALSWLELAIAGFFAYWIPVLALVAFWARTLTLQDLHGEILDVLLIMAAIGLGTILPVLHARKLFANAKPDATLGAQRGSELRAQVEAKPGATLEATLEDRSRSPLVALAFSPRGLIALAAGVLLALLSLGVTYGAPHTRLDGVASGVASGRQTGPGSIATWASNALWLAHLDPYANLIEQDISSKPPNLTTNAITNAAANASTTNGATVDDLLPATRGARLRGRSLRYAQAYRAFLAKAELWGANLQSADLSEADLRLADLHRSSLRWAVLNHAELFRANLEGADLRGANFFQANLSEANLSSVLLSGAMLNEARLGLANLYGADMHSAQLLEADLEGADLRGANLEHAKLAGAVLQNAYLSSGKLGDADLRGAKLGQAFLSQADLRNADLRGADLRGATLADADMSGANLEGADLRGASGLRLAQLCSAHFNAETQFDPSVGMPGGDLCSQK